MNRERGLHDRVSTLSYSNLNLKYWLGFPIIGPRQSILCAGILFMSRWLHIGYLPYLGQHLHRIQVSKLVMSHAKNNEFYCHNLDSNATSAGFEPTSSAREPESESTTLLRHSMCAFILLQLYFSNFSIHFNHFLRLSHKSKK